MRSGVAFEARRVLGRCVQPGGLRDDANLALSEAVNNVVRHTATAQLRLVVRHDEEAGALMCAVRDDRPDLRSAGRRAMGCGEKEEGRGIGIIESLSCSWGFSTDGRGKWLWFCLGSS
ncbi:ATP-binding protein [Streptomyces sp. NPDC051577]|uniref:ATP-binding protein n=1 Tax=Streptomyces sp. NPDC051577 TaxID=3155166 RepID=UPI003426AEC1